jgi:hypothetical protein
MEVALKQRGIDKLLDEAREDNKENDAVYLGRKCRSWVNHRSRLCLSVMRLSNQNDRTKTISGHCGTELWTRICGIDALGGPSSLFTSS